MNDNINKGLDKKNLKDKETKQVSGGNGNVDSKVYEDEIKDCKYCKKKTLQVFKGSGIGYDENGQAHGCHLWECTVCKNVNYWKLLHGKEMYII